MGLELKGMVILGNATVGANFVWNENHSNEIDGINAVFVMDNSFVAGFTKVKYNGQELTLGVDYQEKSDTEIELLFVPVIGDTLIFDYLKD